MEAGSQDIVYSICLFISTLVNIVKICTPSQYRSCFLAP